MNLLAVFGLGGPEIFLILALVFGFGFWLWMLIDCITNEADQTQKIVWALVILLVGIVGAPLYFFVRWIPRNNRRPVSQQPDGGNARPH